MPSFARTAESEEVENVVGDVNEVKLKDRVSFGAHSQLWLNRPLWWPSCWKFDPMEQGNDVTLQSGTTDLLPRFDGDAQPPSLEAHHTNL